MRDVLIYTPYNLTLRKEESKKFSLNGFTFLIDGVKSHYAYRELVATGLMGVTVTMILKRKDWSYNLWHAIKFHDHFILLLKCLVIFYSSQNLTTFVHIHALERSFNVFIYIDAW